MFQELESWMNSSKNGVIYVSFGSNVSNKGLSMKTKHILFNVLSNLPYDVLLKWDEDVLIRHVKNIKIGKWFPQSDLLRKYLLPLYLLVNMWSN